MTCVKVQCVLAFSTLTRYFSGTFLQFVVIVSFLLRCDNEKYRQHTYNVSAGTPRNWNLHWLIVIKCSMLVDYRIRPFMSTDVTWTRHDSAVISFPVDFKLALLVYRAVHDATASYLVDDCQLVSHAGRRRLRSADIDTCCVPRTNTARRSELRSRWTTALEQSAS